MLCWPHVTAALSGSFFIHCCTAVPFHAWLTKVDESRRGHQLAVSEWGCDFPRESVLSLTKRSRHYCCCLSVTRFLVKEVCCRPWRSRRKRWIRGCGACSSHSKRQALCVLIIIRGCRFATNLLHPPRVGCASSGAGYLQRPEEAVRFCVGGKTVYQTPTGVSTHFQRDSCCQQNIFPRSDHEAEKRAVLV